MPDQALPPNLRGKKHWDYPWGLRWIPRGWTAFKWGRPFLEYGRLVPSDYTQGGVTGARFAPKPITSRGTWQLSRFPSGPWFAWYFAFTLKTGRHFRIGARWDDVDGYVEFPSIATRVYSGAAIEDTSTTNEKS